MKNEQLIEEMRKLSPWHHAIQVTPEINTNMFKSDMPDRIMVNHKSPANYFKRAYGQNMVNKSVLDCGCNAGSFLFESARLGIKRGFGFDARQLWIDQANFLKNNVTLYNTDALTFDVMNLYDLPNKNLGNFDVTMFSGLLYHVEDPFLALKMLANITNEILVVNTMYEFSHDQTSQKDCFYYKPEGTDTPLSGINGVAWCPSGESLIIELLRKLGFVEFRLLFKRKEIVKNSNGRLSIAASKIHGILVDPKD